MSAGYIIYSLDWDKFRRLVERPTQKQLRALGKLLRAGLEYQDGVFEHGDPILKWPTDLKALARIAGERLALPDWYGDLSTPGKSLWEGVIYNACRECDDIDVGFRIDNDGVYWDVIEIAWKHHGIVPRTITAAALSAFGIRPYRYRQTPKARMSREEYDKGEGDRNAALSALDEALDEFQRKPKKAVKMPKLEKEKKAIEKAFQGMSKKAVKKPKLKAEKKAIVEEFQDMVLKVFQDPAKLARKLEEAMTDFESTAGFAKLEKIVDKLPTGDLEEWSPMHSMHTPDEVQQMRAELRAAAPAMKATKNKEARRQYEQDLMPAIESLAAAGRMLHVQVDT